VGCYRNILVAVDGSADAAAALRHATSLARDQHAKLILLTVVPAPPPQVVSPGGLLPPPGESDEAYAAILRDAVDTLPPDVGVQTHLRRGRPARRILETARECGCDLIVMGFHGHGRLHHALIGSVSDSVLLASRAPVLLMRAAGPPPEPATGERREGPDPTTTPAADSSVVSGPLR
jgi:nucleotide-binding universal stress UspA family protein